MIGQLIIASNVVAPLVVQSSTQTQIHNAILLIDTLTMFDKILIQ